MRSVNKGMDYCEDGVGGWRMEMECIRSMDVE